MEMFLVYVEENREIYLLLLATDTLVTDVANEKIYIENLCKKYLSLEFKFDKLLQFGNMTESRSERIKLISHCEKVYICTFKIRLCEYFLESFLGNINDEIEFCAPWKSYYTIPT